MELKKFDEFVNESQQTFENNAALKSALDKEKWPQTYMFKCIVKGTETEGVKKCFDDKADISEKASSTGKFTSVTIKAHMESADEVVAAYANLEKVENILNII